MEDTEHSGNTDTVPALEVSASEEQDFDDCWCGRDSDGINHDAERIGV